MSPKRSTSSGTAAGDDVQVKQNGHLQVTWSANGRPLAISLPVKGHEGSRKLVKQMVRRAYRSIDVEVRA